MEPKERVVDQIGVLREPHLMLDCDGDRVSENTRINNENPYDPFKPVFLVDVKPNQNQFYQEQRAVLLIYLEVLLQ